MIYFFLFILADMEFLYFLFALSFFFFLSLFAKNPVYWSIKYIFCKAQEKRREISASELRAKLEQKDGLSNDPKPCATCIVQQSMGPLTL